MRFIRCGFVQGQGLPFSGHFFRRFQVTFSRCFVAQLPCQLAVSGNAQNRFYGQVGISGNMTGKIIGAELISRIEPIFFQVLYPGCQRFPVLLGVVGVAFRFGDSTRQNQHITTFFYGHIFAIGLPVGKGVRPYVVSRKRLRPASTFGILENRLHHAFQQKGVIEQIKRSRGIGNVDRTDGTI